MTEILYGLITGGIVGLLWFLPMPRVLMTLQRAYIGAPKAGKMEPFLRRVSRVLPYGWKINVMLMLILLPVGAFFAVGIQRGSGEFMAGACIAYLLCLTVLEIAGKLGVLSGRGPVEKMGENALKQLGKHAGAVEYIHVIGEVGHKLGPPSFEAAMDVLIRLGSPEARQVMLEVLDRKTNMYSEEVDAYLAQIDLVMSQDQPLSTKKMPVFVKEYNWLKKESRTKSGPEKEELLEKMAEIKVIIDEIVLSQAKLRNLYPDLFCVKCNAAAKMSARGWKQYVHCVRCHDIADLKGGIKHVVGKIGDFPARTLENGELCINLWNPSTQKATYAEFDDLVISEGANIDYNWAVSAVFQEMEQYFSEYAYAFGIQIKGAPDLDENSMKMLREIGYKG